MNQLVSKTMVNISSIQRFPGLQNASLRKICVNLIPFPRLHFFISGLCSKNLNYQSLNKMVHSAFYYDNYSFPGNHFTGHYFTAAGIFRGNISTSQIDVEMHKMKAKHI
jgi:tubulin beta